MKKYFAIAAVLVLAAACSKPQPVSLAPEKNQPSVTPSASPTPTATTTAPSVIPKTPPLTLSVYKDPSGVFSIGYTSDFTMLKNSPACNVGGESPKVCFVLKSEPYKGTNFNSAAVTVRVRTDRADLSKCAEFPASELGLGHLENPIVVNGVTFVTAMSDNIVAGQHTQSHISRGYHNKTCYQINETIIWTDVKSNPPRQEVDKGQIWSKLDPVRGNFRFIK